MLSPFLCNCSELCGRNRPGVFISLSLPWEAVVGCFNMCIRIFYLNKLQLTLQSVEWERASSSLKCSKRKKNTFLKELHKHLFFPIPNPNPNPQYSQHLSSGEKEITINPKQDLSSQNIPKRHLGYNQINYM